MLIFSADKAYRDMRALKESQSIIVSGNYSYTVSTQIKILRNFAFLYYV
jgi:myosin heavy subunit